VDQALRLICVDLPAPPLFDKVAPDGTRNGYEPSAAEAVAAKLGPHCAVGDHHLERHDPRGE
jgi:polar amino acid transport system substrate-binding protein